MYGKPPPEGETAWPSWFGQMVEFTLAAHLMRHGHAVALMPIGHSYDLLVDGRRVEVKASRSGRWQLGTRQKNHSIPLDDRVTYLQSGVKCDSIVFVESDGVDITALHWVDPTGLPRKAYVTTKEVRRVAASESPTIPLISQFDLIRAQSMALATYLGDCAAA